MDKKYAIYSANEAAVGDGCGYWSNEFGWTDVEQATLFAMDEVDECHLPVSTCEDARWVEIDPFRRNRKTQPEVADNPG